MSPLRKADDGKIRLWIFKSFETVFSLKWSVDKISSGIFSTLFLWCCSFFVKNITDGGALCAISWQIFGLWFGREPKVHSLTIALICRRPCITPCPGAAAAETDASTDCNQSAITIFCEKYNQRWRIVRNLPASFHFAATSILTPCPGAAAAETDASTDCNQTALLPFCDIFPYTNCGYYRL